MTGLDAIRARAEAATPGPWRALCDGTLNGDIVWVRSGTFDDIATVTAPGMPHQGDYAADASFIAHARTDIPRLLAVIDAVERKCDRLDAADHLVARALAAEFRAVIADALKDGETP